MEEQKAIEEGAHAILQENPDPVVRFRLLRDVLREPSNTDTFGNAQREMIQTRWVLQLKNGQREDGGWGRFHSAMKTRGKIGATEAAVERGLALGLEASGPVLRSTVAYLSRLLGGLIDFPDPPERKNRWVTGEQLFAAATLARICPTHPALDQTWEFWATIARRTFSSGTYDPEAEVQAHQVLTGASVKDSYLVLNNRYACMLSNLIKISARLRKSYRCRE